ncbi:hypothetical protein SUDANB176_06167 [Streptomyces sp. enrichment culture]|uniref:hypothetical protein n=1 Tax=Streptomyces sp. enrichment culture TaxID=1795815 RepID=UPI003F55B7E1
MSAALAPSSPPSAGVPVARPRTRVLALPEDKANAVRDLRTAGRTVLFVGDEGSTVLVGLNRLRLLRESAGRSGQPQDTRG